MWLEEPSEALRPGVPETISAPPLLQEAGGTVGHPSDIQTMVTKAKLSLKATMYIMQQISGSVKAQHVNQSIFVGHIDFFLRFRPHKCMFTYTMHLCYSLDNWQTHMPHGLAEQKPTVTGNLLTLSLYESVWRYLRMMVGVAFSMMSHTVA